MVNTTQSDKEIGMADQEVNYDNVVAICPRCRGAICQGEMAYVVGKHKVMNTDELMLVENVEKVCENCYPRMEVRWPDATDHEHGDGAKALDVILAEEAPATG